LNLPEDLRILNHRFSSLHSSPQLTLSFLSLIPQYLCQHRLNTDLLEKRLAALEALT
jgi:hypothetical protein